MVRRTRTEMSTDSAILERIAMYDEDYATARKAVLSKQIKIMCAAVGEPTNNYIPDDKQLPDAGHWIQIIYPPTCEVTAEHLSIWYAMPAFKESQWDFMFGQRGSRYKIKILTPIGEFMLFPHEYNLVKPDALSEYINMLGKTADETVDHVVLHWLDPRNEQFDIDKLFYIMSRGVTKSDAYKMLMGEVQSPHVCYFTFHEEYQYMFAGTGIGSLRARGAIEAHIRFVAKEKKAGTWYDLRTAEARAAANAEAEAKAEERRKEEDLERALTKKRNKAFGSMLDKAFPSLAKPKRRRA